jgi:hypothetical protein
MSLSIIDARMVNKILTTGTPSQAPSSDHTDGTWIETDVYISEIVLNTTDERVWIMGQNGPLELYTTSGATAGVFGSGTINRLTKWTGSSDIGDSIISESGGVVSILTTGNAATPALTLNDTTSGFFGTTENINITIGGTLNTTFRNEEVEIEGELLINGNNFTSGRTRTASLLTPETFITSSGVAPLITSLTIDNGFVRVRPNGDDITLRLPSTSGITPSPQDGHRITIFKEGDAAGDVFIKTEVTDAMIEPGSNTVRDSVKIATAITNVSISFIYSDDLEKWITTAFTPDISAFEYQTTI